MSMEDALKLVREYRAAGGQRSAITLPSGNLGLDLWQVDSGDALAFWNANIVPLNPSQRSAFLRALFEIPA